MYKTFLLGISTPTLITIYPASTYEDLNYHKRSEHRMRYGTLKEYKWFGKAKFKIPLDWINTSDYSVVNSWWVSRVPLILAINHSSPTSMTLVHTVAITNAVNPLPQFNYPHIDHYKGVLDLEEY